METTATNTVKPFHWRTLLSLSALANLSILLYMAFAHRDTLALALAGAVLIGIVLSRFRNGMTGILLLGLLFTDIAFWTGSGAVNNLINGEQGLAFLLPSFLGIISLAGLISTAGSVINRRKMPEESRTAAMVAGAAVGLLVIAALASLGIRTPETNTYQAAQISLGSKNMVYSSSRLDTSAGDITVKLANEDLWWHTFTIDELGVDLRVPMGAERSVTFKAPAGVYRYYCGIPGHEAIGMYGTLTVEE